MKTRKTRYIAVDHGKDEHTRAASEEERDDLGHANRGSGGNNVYDVKSPPPVGSTAKFDTYSAEYVGSGS